MKNNRARNECNVLPRRLGHLYSPARTAKDICTAKAKWAQYGVVGLRCGPCGVAEHLVSAVRPAYSKTPTWRVGYKEMTSD